MQSRYTLQNCRIDSYKVKHKIFMLKIAVIGLGDIAQKAYLPILTAMSGVELIFCTRQADRLQSLAKQYRVAHTETDYRQLPQHGIHAAFVHSATSAHVEITDFYSDMVSMCISINP